MFYKQPPLCVFACACVCVVCVLVCVYLFTFVNPELQFITAHVIFVSSFADLKLAKK